MKNIRGKFSLKAIIAGSAFDIIGTNVVLFIYTMIFMLSSGVFKNPAVSNTNLTQLFVDQNLYQTFVIASLMSILGGLIAAIIARKHEFLNSLAVLLLTVTVAFLSKFWISSDVHFPEWFKPLSYIISPFLYLSGGYIGSLINRKRTNSPGSMIKSKLLVIILFLVGLIPVMAILVAVILLGYSSTKIHTATKQSSEQIITSGEFKDCLDEGVDLLTQNLSKGTEKEVMPFMIINTREDFKAPIKKHLIGFPDLPYDEERIKFFNDTGVKFYNDYSQEGYPICIVMGSEIWIKDYSDENDIPKIMEKPIRDYDDKKEAISVTGMTINETVGAVRFETKRNPDGTIQPLDKPTYEKIGGADIKPYLLESFYQGFNNAMTQLRSPTPR